MRKLNKTLIAAAGCMLAAFAASPAFASGFNADVHAGIDGFHLEGAGNGTNFSYGVGVGYDYEVNEKFFVGAQLGLDEERLALGVNQQRNLSAVLRAGYKITSKDTVYALGGYANQYVAVTGVDGWRVGAGYERAITNKVFVKAEYRYSDYKKYGLTASQNAGLIGVGVHF